ncbi:hypothetical protein [Rhodoferax sp. PAMC 29310]|jgi:hypothetical protein|uniref:hypothetical protein n=1 Tax=Rhodoferax sp. PAMC 29310 TaxID=2822760 RepID=UPI001B31E222|nr:hypothetical protein [Rhodoferax sp. PAMC 29310]
MNQEINQNTKKKKYADEKVIDWIQEQPKDEFAKTKEQQLEEAEFAISWIESITRADHWFSMPVIDPLEAAMLLCQVNPNEATEDVFLRLETYREDGASIESSPQDHKEILQQLQTLQRHDSTPRTLIQWWQAAKDRGIKHHSWIDRYIKATGRTDGAGQPTVTVKETAKERRTRWLEWFEAVGGRGALERVYERELLLNPKADRSAIGKAIKKADKERHEETRNGMWNGLETRVKDGKKLP